jgi:uncharacterized phage-associated protein
MNSAKAIANYFLDKGDADNITITPMQINKLVYIAHGWHLALRNTPLIVDRIEAWDLGPVIPELYHEFKHFGSDQITDRAYEEIIASVHYDKLTDEPIDDFLDEAWDEYKHFNGWELSGMTHQQNTPWDITRKNNKFRFKKNPPIDNELIRQYYLNMKDKPYDEFKSTWYPF